MPAQVGGVTRDGDGVPGAGRYRTVAAGAHVVLRRLVWLHPPHLDGAVQTVPDVLRHVTTGAASTEEAPGDEQCGKCDCRTDEPDVGAPGNAFPCGVQSHAPTLRRGR